jgi:intron-binding protein aquarius
MSFNNSKRKANLPFNKKGRIAPYTKDGGRRAHDKGGSESGTTRFKPRHSAPTMDQIQSDRLTKFANQYWSPQTNKQHLDYSADVIEDIYKVDLNTPESNIRRVMMLEFSQYLENYLWPNFDDKASLAHVLSIVYMINEKFRERVPAWIPFQKKGDEFPSFFRKIMTLSLATNESISLREQKALIIFLGHCFTSMEVELVRVQIQKLVSLSMWESILEARRDQELKNIPKWKKFWKAIQKKDAKVTDENVKVVAKEERWFMRKVIDKFVAVLDTIQEKAAPRETVDYCEHFLLLMIDLEALLPTRRFFNTVLDDSQLITHCSLSALNKREEGKLFSQLLDMLKFYARFEISDETGDPLNDKDMMQIHYNRITSLQLAVFAKYPEMRKFALTTVASIDDRENLANHFKDLSKETLYDVAEYLFLVPAKATVNLEDFDRNFLAELLISRHEKRDSQLQELNEMPLYPTEDIIWNQNIVPGEFYNGEGVLALPKLNLQFLTLHDYLLRNFKLFQLESTYEIRGDVEDAVSRLKPWTTDEGEVIFGGWARMALPITSFAIVEVAKPNIGEKQPSRVRADVSVNLSVKDAIKNEWENLRRHDVCFLVTVRPAMAATAKNFNYMDDFVPQAGLMYVRGCEVQGMLDDNGRVIEEGPDPRPQIKGEGRSFRVLLDPNQYHQDMERASAGGEDTYDTFNILMRRKPKENNFKAVLETIRELMNTQCVVPDFLHDIILGYGDPGAAHYRNMDNKPKTLNFNDTFVSFDHLRHSFPMYDVKVDHPEAELVPPFKVTFNDEPVEEGQKPSILVQPYTAENRGPYPQNEPKKNTVPFTPTQVEAIRAGTSPGLTMVVGPPGTGKTDVAVQIIANLYHNFPEQRTVIVTHSNQALNQLFEKIMALDIDERHLLRLGHGEESLETEKDFSRYGRVNYVLAKRIELLEKVNKLQASLGVHGDVAYTCETSGYFFLYQIQSRWEQFNVNMGNASTTPIDDIEKHFPFHGFFSDAPLPLFKGKSYDEDYEIAMGCWRHIQDIFTQLEEFRAFELLRSGLDRTRYLGVKEAKIIAMTCTHAALKRKDLVQMGFKYDNIIMEESAQILEIETFIPLLLQNPMDGHNRLKRWIMIGDHHQLPPVIKNMAFQKFSNMEQSLFTRLVRLGVPTVDLDAQGRARPSICSLYNWRYKCLGNLSHVLNEKSYLEANAGFSYDFQLVNIPDFNGVGESSPSPFFYQNLGEAEFVVATFMYMRLIGYPAEKISILTTYNGQKHLIRDVVNAR